MFFHGIVCVFKVTVPTPDYIGRKEILNLYLGKILAKEIDVDVLARGTTGFTGADLENMVNQAALRYLSFPFHKTASSLLLFSLL